MERIDQHLYSVFPFLYLAMIILIRYLRVKSKKNKTLSYVKAVTALIQASSSKENNNEPFLAVHVMFFF